jgi:hypothetical protein
MTRSALHLSNIHFGILAACLALMVCWVSGSLNGRFQHKAEVVSQQSAILHRQPLYFDGGPGDLPEFHNRVLMPALLRLSEHTRVASLQEWFIAWRLITAFLMFATFIVVTDRGSWQWSIIGSGLLAYSLILSFGHPWEHPTDFPDVAFTVGFCALAMAGKPIALALLAVIAAANRESAAFAGLIWICIHGYASGRWKWRELLKGAAISAAAYITVVALRQRFSVPGTPFRQLVVAAGLPDTILAFLKHPNPFGWPVMLAATVTPIGLLLWAMRHDVTEKEGRLLVAALAMFMVSLIFGKVDELRVFLPAIAVSMYSLALIGARGERSAGESLGSDQGEVSPMLHKHQDRHQDDRR